MKKIRLNHILFALLVLFLSCNRMEVQAGPLDQLTTDPDYGSILAFSDTIAGIAGSCFPARDQPITADDIVFEDAIKDYIDNDIFSNEVITEEYINKIKKDIKYVWLIPIYTEKATIWVTVADRRLMEMSKEELEREKHVDVQKLEREWTVTQTSTNEEKVPYRNKIKEAVVSTLGGSYNDYNIIVLGGTPEYRSLIALINDGGTNAYIYPLESYSTTPYMEEAAGENDSKGTLYRFEDLQKEASKMVFDGKLIGGPSLDLNDFNPMELKNTGIATGVMLTMELIILIIMSISLYKVHKTR